MFKKIAFAFVLMILTACNQILPSTTRQTTTSQGFGFRYNPFDVTDYEEGYEDYSSSAFKVAMLLPLSGKASTYGKGMQNAAMMALEDTNNKNLEVRFYDTKSSQEGAQNALSTALAGKAQLVLGPLMADEVSAISYQARNKGVPIISFSTAPHVLGDGVYTLGLLANEQVKRILSYAASQNRRNVAVIVPDSPAGLNMAKSAVYTAADNAMTVTKIGFYEPTTLEFSNLVQQMSASKDFDTVLIAETGSRLKAIAGTFGYFDISYPDVLFLGTSVWENTNLTKETTLYKGVYPVISRVHNDYFEKKYKDLFGETPNSLYSYAYDSIALASALSRQGDKNLYTLIENPDGYIGINGSFRLFGDGTNEHNLDIVEVNSSGLKKVSSSPKSFGAKPYSNQSMITSRPQIYGKGQEIVYEKLFPSVQTPSYFNIF